MPDSASTPAVTLSEAGKAKLNALLADQVVNADLPAIFNGITTADGDIYFNCAGRKNQGDESEGSVDENTSELLMPKAIGRAEEYIQPRWPIVCIRFYPR